MAARTGRAQTRLVGTAYVDGNPVRQQFEVGSDLLDIKDWASTIEGATALKVEAPPYDLSDVYFYVKNEHTGRWNRCSMPAMFRAVTGG